MLKPTNDTAETVQIVFRGTPEMRHRLQTAALARNMKVQGLLEFLVEKHVFSDGSDQLPIAKGLPHASAQDIEIARLFLEWMHAARCGEVDGLADQPACEMILKLIGVDPKTLDPKA